MPDFQEPPKCDEALETNESVAFDAQIVQTANIEAHIPISASHVERNFKSCFKCASETMGRRQNKIKTSQRKASRRRKGKSTAAAMNVIRLCRIKVDEVGTKTFRPLAQSSAAAAKVSPEGATPDMQKIAIGVHPTETPKRVHRVGERSRRSLTAHARIATQTAASQMRIK